MIGRPASLVLACLVAVGCASVGCASAGCASAGADDPAEDAGVAVVDAEVGAIDGRPTIDAAAPLDAPPPDAEPCTGGDATVVDPATGHCYRLYVVGQNWGVARTLCDAFGSDTHLVTITDAAENAIVRQLGGNLHVWLGFTDAAVENQWAWVTGQALGFINWESGEPNNDGNEDCAELQGELAGVWNDRKCGDSLAYVCERE